MVKIAMVSGGYYPYIGGVETVVKQTSEGLVQKGFDVEVLTQDRLQKYPPTELVNGVKVRRFKTGPMGWDFDDSGCSLRGFLKSNSDEYDLIHAHGYHCFSPLYAAWAKGRNRLVLNAHYHGIGHNLLMTLLLQPYHHVGKTVFEKADKVVCVSKTEKLRIQKDFAISEGKLSIIPNGVEYEEIAQAIPFPRDGRLLLCVSRLEKFKNVQLAIRALPHLPKEYRLVIVGSGPYKTKLLQLIDGLHLSHRVQILSGLSNPELYRWYKTCDLVLNLSSQEAFGITVIEGLAAAKPVLVNNRMALAELATRLGGVRAVDAQRLPPEMLATEISLICGAVVDKPDLGAYTNDSIAEQIKDLYLSLLDGHKSRTNLAGTHIPEGRVKERVHA